MNETVPSIMTPIGPLDFTKPTKPNIYFEDLDDGKCVKVVEFGKLVRDKMPSIIGGRKTGSFRTLEYPEYIAELRTKLSEEINEYLDEPSFEELADIYEVVATLARHDLESKGEFGFLHVTELVTQKRQNELEDVRQAHLREPVTGLFSGIRNRMREKAADVAVTKHKLAKHRWDSWIGGVSDLESTLHIGSIHYRQCPSYANLAEVYGAVVQLAKYAHSPKGVKGFIALVNTAAAKRERRGALDDRLFLIKTEETWDSFQDWLYSLD